MILFSKLVPVISATVTTAVHVCVQPWLSILASVPTPEEIQRTINSAVRNTIFKSILCNSPNCRSVVVLQVFENPDNFVIGRIADDVVLPGKQVPFTFLNKTL